MSAGWNDAANEFGALVDLKVRAVCEDTGEPLPGVRLRWESRTPDGLEFPVTVRATTDANGDARLRGLSFGGVNPFRSDRHFIRRRGNRRLGPDGAHSGVGSGHERGVDARLAARIRP